MGPQPPHRSMTDRRPPSKGRRGWGRTGTAQRSLQSMLGTPVARPKPTPGNVDVAHALDEKPPPRMKGGGLDGAVLFLRRGMTHFLVGK